MSRLHSSRAPLTTESRHSPRFLIALLLLFVGSGCAALIYEIVWFQLLQLVIGSSAVSLGVLLGTFMGGMCLGSLLLPRVSRAGLASAARLRLARAGHRRHRPARPVRHAARRRRLHGVGRRRGVRASCCAVLAAGICLLPPTMLMGATLPAIARWVEATPRGVSWLGFFYGGNIAGAVVGSLLAGFYLLRVYDIAVATYVAVALNVAVALVALAIAHRGRRISRAASRRPRGGRPRPMARSYVAIALSGMTALVGAGDLDAPPVAAVRRDGLHLLADPRRVPGRPRHRQQRRVGRSRATLDAAARRARLVPGAAVRGDGLDARTR